MLELIGAFVLILLVARLVIFVGKVVISTALISFAIIGVAAIMQWWVVLFFVPAFIFMVLGVRLVVNGTKAASI
jgi:hypothetical protein